MQLREMFLNNVRLHLRSDVALGAALSGGIDSSAVVCAMRYLEPDMPIHTFTYVARGSNVDEEKWADIVNDHVGAIPHKVVVSSNELTTDIEDMVRVQGEPFGSTSIYAQYRVFKAAREAGIIVTLDGQGADELLAGYNGYPASYFHSLIDGRNYLKLLSYIHKWSKWPGRGYIKAVIAFAQLIIPTHLRGIAFKMLGQNPKPYWINGDYLSNMGVVLAPPSKNQIYDDEYGRRLMSTLRESLLGNGLASLLRHGDRNSMRWSVESRVPFLTTELAEFILSLPESYLLSSEGETKHVFREAMRGIVPDIILDRKDKIGFQTPEKNWLFDQKQMINEALADRKLPFMKNKSLLSYISKIEKKSRQKTSEVWRFVNFCKWSDSFK
jgi:asparagine synthase (glutamine-hydrolysing)